jgi:putative sigma-54 modulation protein
MNIILTGRNLEIAPALKNYVEKKLKRFNRYLSNISEAVVTISVEKYRHKVEVLLKVNGFLIQAEGITGEVYSSIDDVTEKLERQIKKYKEKLVSHRKSEGKEVPVLTENLATADVRRIIKNKQFELKPMSPDEAAMQMDLLDKSFFVFTNYNSGDINVIYRRKDGNFGLIEPLR